MPLEPALRSGQHRGASDQTGILGDKSTGAQKAKAGLKPVTNREYWLMVCGLMMQHDVIGALVEKFSAVGSSGCSDRPSSLLRALGPAHPHPAPGDPLHTLFVPRRPTRHVAAMIEDEAKSRFVWELWTLQGVAYLVVGLRFGCRIRGLGWRKLAWDDALMLLAAVRRLLSRCCSHKKGPLINSCGHSSSSFTRPRASWPIPSSSSGMDWPTMG